MLVIEDEKGSPWTWTVTLNRPMEQDQIVLLYGSMDEAYRFAVCHAVRQITHHEWLGHKLDTEWRAGLIVLAKKGLLASFVTEYNEGRIMWMHGIRVDRTSHEKCDEKDLARAIQTLEDRYEDLPCSHQRILGPDTERCGVPDGEGGHQVRLLLRRRVHEPLQGVVEHQEDDPEVQLGHQGC